MKYFESVIGYEDVKLELSMMLDALRSPEKYKALGVKSPRGVLLHGDPGIGKTMLSSAFLRASERPSFVCRKDKPNGAFVDEIKNTFEKAMEAAPSVILLDDVDKFANEDCSRSDAEEYVTIQSCIDNIKSEGKDVFIFATANNLMKLPRSLIRVGRFDKVIEMKVPCEKDAEKIIKHYLSEKKKVELLDCAELARIMKGNSCAELEAVINEAGMYAAYAGRDVIMREDVLRAVMREIFEAPESLEQMDALHEREIAIHEAGHTVVSEILSPGSVNLVSINRHSGNIGGITSYHQGDDYWYSLGNMERRVISLLGGRAASEIKLGAVDVGANSDLRRAFDIVERFVDDYCAYGFDKFERQNSSGTLLQRKESYIHSELDRYNREAKRIIAENIAFLDRITEALIEKKTVTASDISRLRLI